MQLSSIGKYRILKILVANESVFVIVRVSPVSGTNNMKTMIENYINGNLSTARKQAKRFSHKAIREALMDYGYSTNKATLTADWLKTGEGFQAACDAE